MFVNQFSGSSGPEPCPAQTCSTRYDLPRHYALTTVTRDVSLTVRVLLTIGMSIF